MDCESCRTALSVDKNRVSSVNDNSTYPCECEAFSVSEYSPGVVNDGELIHYLVPTPGGRAENGTLSPANAVQLFRNGLSVLRDDANNEEFLETINELQPRWQSNEKQLEGVLSFKASSVKFKDGERVCCIYDTGLPLKPHHADLMGVAVLVNGNPPPSKTMRENLEKVRIKQIIDLIGSDFTEASEFRGGIFADVVIAA